MPFICSSNFWQLKYIHVQQNKQIFENIGFFVFLTLILLLQLFYRCKIKKGIFMIRHV